MNKEIDMKIRDLVKKEKRIQEKIKSIDYRIRILERPNQRLNKQVRDLYSKLNIEFGKLNEIWKEMDSLQY